MADQPVEQPKKKRGGCLKAGLIFLLVMLLLLGVASAVLFKIPRKLGWVKGQGERFTELTHERLTAEEIVDEAEAKGFESEGVKVYVFPKPDTDEAVMFISYDFSKEGTVLTRSGAYTPAVTALVMLGGGAKAKEHAITHVGAEFRDEEGKLILEIAASTADIRELQEGKVSEDVFVKERLATQVDLPNYFQRAVIPF